MITWIYPGYDGRSHLEDLEFTGGEDERVTPKPGQDLIFRQFAPNRFSDWHHPSRRQYLFIVGGRMEVSVDDGSSRKFQDGNVVLAEDMIGQGHVIKGVGGTYKYVSIGPPDLPSE